MCSINTFMRAAGLRIGRILGRAGPRAGGGAFLEVLVGKRLPAFETLQRRAAQ